MTSTDNKLLNTRTDFDDSYEFGDEIGKGRYATVKKCYCKKTGQCYAAKVIKNFRTKNKFNLNIVENEVTALTLARSHWSIVNLYEVFYHRGETILILEYATEKDLHIYLDCEGAFEEEKACHIIYQVLKALEFLHSKQVLHLDIKPENVLLMSPLSKSNCDLEVGVENQTHKHEPVRVKLCDFSFSQIMQPGKPIYGMMGTVAYQAPEVLEYEPLTKATDMWSLGVLTHVLLTEYTPFGNGSEQNLQTETNILNVRDKEFKCIEEDFENISIEAQEFIESLVKFRPKHRLTVEEALNHKWFKKFGINSDTETNQQTISNTSSCHLSSTQIKTSSSTTSTTEQTSSSHKTVELIKEETTLLSNCNNNNNNNIKKLKNDFENDDDRINNNLSKLIESIEIVATETIKTNNKNNELINQTSKNVNSQQSINCVFDSSTKLSISTTSSSSSNKHYHQQQPSQHGTNISIINKKHQEIDAQLITNRQEELNKTNSSKITCSSILVAASATSTSSNQTNKLTATPVSNN